MYSQHPLNMKYRATYKFRKKPLNKGPVRDLESTTEWDAREAVRLGAVYAAILKDSEGSDHPDNANKFFLHRYIKA